MSSYGERQAMRPFSTGCMMVLLLAGFVVMGVRSCTDCVGLTEPDAARAEDGGGDGVAEDAFAQTAPVDAPSATHCGSAEATVPGGVSAETWARFRCLDRTAVGERWPDCLCRSAYAAAFGLGCPGATGAPAEQRCCPPRERGATVGPAGQPALP